MKKVGVIAMAALLTVGVGSYSTKAQEIVEKQVINEQVEKNNEQQVDASNYMKYAGVITEIEKDKEEVRVTVENDEKAIMILRLNKDTQLFNSGTTKSVDYEKLEKGATVEAYYDKNKPMILIYPATVTPELIIIKDEEIFGEVKVGKFDEDFLSLDEQLKLNVNEETPMFNEQGEKIETTDLADKDLIVFYTATTMSIPAQTAPSKIIAMDDVTEEVVEDIEVDEDVTVDVTEEMKRVNAIIAADHYEKDGVVMIPLRKVAEELGYTVLSQPKVNGALLTKGNRSLTITRGEKMYGINKSLGKFQVAPALLEKNKTYVTEEFLEQLLEK